MAEHIEEIDYLRGFAILAVIVIHTVAYFTFIQPLNMLVTVNASIDVIVHFAVPLFVVISGIVLSVNYRDKYDLRKFYDRRFLSIIPAYVVFTIFYVYVNSGALNFNSIVQNLLFARASYHLWFFALILELYIFYPLINNIYQYFENKGHSNMFLLSTLCLQIMWIILVQYPFHILNSISATVLSMVYFPAYIFYFVLGMYAYRNLEMIKKQLLTQIPSAYLILGSIFVLGLDALTLIEGINAYGGYNNLPNYYNLVWYVIPLAGYACIFGLCYRAAVYLNSNKGLLSLFVRKMGKYSFGIYLVHIFFLTIIIDWLKTISITYSDAIFYPLSLMGTIIMSFISVYIISFLPYSNYFIGCISVFDLKKCLGSMRSWMTTLSKNIIQTTQKSLLKYTFFVRYLIHF